MDRNYLLDLLVSVRERNVDVNTALDEICAMGNNVDAGENTLPIQRVSNNEVAVCPKCASKDVIWTVYCNDCNEAM